jgi:hypothetical protein
MTTLIRLLIAVEAATFFVGAVLHLGVPVLGLDEPRIVPAAIVEGLCGAVLGAAALWYLRPDWGSRIALVALAVATGGVLLGMVALAAGRGPSTPLNTAYHRTVLVALIATALFILADRLRTRHASRG